MFYPKNSDGGLNLRYRRGSSISGMIGKMIISEVLNSSYKSKWRIGNDINRCALCCRCEIVVHSLPYEMSDRPQKSSIVIYK